MPLRHVLPLGLRFASCVERRRRDASCSSELRSGDGGAGRRAIASSCRLRVASCVERRRDASCGGELQSGGARARRPSPATGDRLHYLHSVLPGPQTEGGGRLLGIGGGECPGLAWKLAPRLPLPTGIIAP